MPSAGSWPNIGSGVCQAAFVATIQGISKDNGGSDSGDFSHDVVGSGFVAGTTNFTSAAYLRAKLTMGDSMDGLSTIMVHSVVYTQMAENNLIDFIPDARGETQFPTFMGMNVVMDDGMPSGTGVVRKDGSAGAAGMYETWLFGPGAVLLGSGNAPVPMEVQRLPAAGNGQGYGGLAYPRACGLFIRRDSLIPLPLRTAGLRMREPRIT